MAAVAGAQPQQLQGLVFGAAGGAGRGYRKRLADGLVKVHLALGNIASTRERERVKILYQKIEDAIKYLDPQYIDRMAVPDAVKLQFILAGPHRGSRTSVKR
ncbi:dynactin subunit 3-like [Hemicordylus capensis]|uniref:dynactin subunit 3-like n=1 Tax=Hemicordylus capensis TaxID=884348 RepID=UPI0023028536|nr:dynactin subunit 3-like [Hemicordylus capensis]